MLLSTGPFRAPTEVFAALLHWTAAVGTNLRERAALVYAFYGRRGETENRIKELDNDLDPGGRTSCSAFPANQLRVLLSATAYVLFP